MNTERWLPAGSVVMLKNSTKRVMIMGFLQIRQEDRSKVYDYCGCLYPEGYQDAEHVYLFDNDQIETVYGYGYRDDEQLAFAGQLEEAASEI